MLGPRAVFAATRLLMLLGAAAGYLTPGYAAWPADSAIKLIVPSPPGGSNDVVARIISESLAKALGQTIVVDNRPGAAGAIGIQAVAQAKPDGYTIGVASNTSTFLDVVRPNQPWNFKRDIQAVAMIGDQPISVAVPANSPYRSIADLVAAARTRPGSLSYGTSGIGTTQHLVGERFAHVAKIKWVHVPYKGGSQATADLVSGQIPVAVVGLVPMLAHHSAGRVRILAVTSAARDPLVPDVPTMAESGFPQFRVSQWMGLVMPRGTPSAVIARVSEEVNKLLADPAIKARIVKAGLDPSPMSAAQFDKFMFDEADIWGSLIRDLNIKLD